MRLPFITVVLRVTNIMMSLRRPNGHYSSLMIIYINTNAASYIINHFLNYIDSNR
jgi:hypothetical protein